MIRFDGKKDPERRRLAEAGQVVPLRPEGFGEMGHIFVPYRKTQPVYVVRVNLPFEVDTLEGVHSGKQGDWLALGTSGELYPIDAAVFAESYERAEEESNGQG